MFREIRPAIVLLLLLTAITGLAYPLAMTGDRRCGVSREGAGQPDRADGKVVGSALIGQEFKDDKYFHGRPSATLAPDPSDSTKTVSAPYNAANSGGSNLGPTSKALADRLKEDVDKLKAENPNTAVPVDLVTTSASGLDPDIFARGGAVPGAADRQGAQPSGRSGPATGRLQHRRARCSACSAKPRVNVLALNLALDRASAK